jgi:hypothetical protein
MKKKYIYMYIRILRFKRKIKYTNKRIEMVYKKPTRDENIQLISVINRLGGL